MRRDAGRFTIDFLERSAASDDLLRLGVESGLFKGSSCKVKRLKKLNRIDFLERSAASVDLWHLGVESWRHGQAGGWEARGQVALGHEVIVENSFYSGSFQGIVLK